MILASGENGTAVVNFKKKDGGCGDGSERPQRHNDVSEQFDEEQLRRSEGSNR